jgi:hypothetical protein
MRPPLLFPDDQQVWTTRGPVNNDDPSGAALRKVGTADSDGMAGSAA